MFFDSLRGLARVAIVGVSAYAALIVALRLSGKRTLSKFNAFDLVVTVALGSTLATVLLSRTVALTEGILALVTLVALQFAVAWSTTRWEWPGRVVRSRPTVLIWQGAVLADQLRRERVDLAEIHQALRQQGIASVGEVGAVVLETDGSISVLRTVDEGPDSSLAGVPHTAGDEAKTTSDGVAPDPSDDRLN